MRYVAQARGGIEMPYVEIRMLEGRSAEQRLKLTEAITEAVATTLGVSKESVWIEFVDVPRTHFAIGGVLTSSTGGQKPHKS